VNVAIQIEGHYHGLEPQDLRSDAANSDIVSAGVHSGAYLVARPVGRHRSTRGQDQRAKDKHGTSNSKRAAGATRQGYRRHRGTKARQGSLRRGDRRG
jgi:hypothetical protein